MKRLLIVLAAALPLSACAYGGGYAAGYGSPVAYDGYYDDYYGPIYDGYWGDGDAFYYRTSERGHYVRDTHSHFRHDMAGGPGGPNPGGPNPGGPGGGPGPGGFHTMHGMGPGSGGHHHH